jgi:hypothetical protein
VVSTPLGVPVFNWGLSLAKRRIQEQNERKKLGWAAAKTILEKKGKGSVYL